ncbi:unnamed protein product, partial [Ectocarpus fasciculatus]
PRGQSFQALLLGHPCSPKRNTNPKLFCRGGLRTRSAAVYVHSVSFAQFRFSEIVLRFLGVCTAEGGVFLFVLSLLPPRKNNMSKVNYFCRLFVWSRYPRPGFPSRPWCQVPVVL